MKKVLSLAISCFFLLAVQAQENLNKEVIDVVKDFRPKVMQANKIKSQPIFIDTTKVSENLQYLIRFEEFRVRQNVDSLEANVLVRPELSSLYTKHAELGLGSLLNPHLSFGISNGRDTKRMYHALLNYDGAFYNKLPLEDKYSKLDLSSTYKQVFETSKLEFDVYIKDIFRHDSLNTTYRNSSFGFDTQLEFTDSNKVVIPKILKLSTDLFYRGLEFVESKVLAEIEHQGVHDRLQKWSFRNTARIQNSNSYSYFQWNTKAQSKKSFERTDVQVALALDVLEGDVKVFPELKVQYKLIEKGLYAYAEIGGGRNLYSWGDMYSQNPYIHNRSLSSILYNGFPIGTLPSPEYSLEYNYGAHNNTSYYSILGLNGNLFRGVSYQVSVTAKNQNNFMHFVHLQNEYSDEREIETWVSPEYTELNSVQLHAELDAKWTEKFHLWLKADYISMDKHLSYVPELEVGLYVDYHYNDQWFISTSARYIGEREALTYSEGIYCYQEIAEQLNPVIDANLKVNFAYNKQMGFYLEAANLLNQDFILWQERPVLGRQLNFGAKYRF